MKHFITSTILIFVFLSVTNYTQPLQYNLKNLNELNVVVRENGLLSNSVQKKLETEIKLKLMSAGIKVLSHDATKPMLEIYCDAIESNFAAHRIIVLLKLYEGVTTNRIDKPETEAITYFDYSFFAAKGIEDAIYNEVMDKMIISFIKKYLNDNSGN